MLISSYTRGLLANYVCLEFQFSGDGLDERPPVIFHSTRQEMCSGSGVMILHQLLLEHVVFLAYIYYIASFLRCGHNIGH